MKARIKFRKYGSLRFIGHLDVMRFFQKVMRRADIPIAFSGGYSPHMIMSFANPLGIGLTSDGEYFDIELTEAVNSADAVRRMNEACQIEGIEIVSIRRIAEEKKMTGMTILAGADYLTSVRKGAFPEDWKERFSEFMEQPEIRIVKQTPFPPFTSAFLAIISSPYIYIISSFSLLFHRKTPQPKPERHTSSILNHLKHLLRHRFLFLLLNLHLRFPKLFHPLQFFLSIIESDMRVHIHCDRYIRMPHEVLQRLWIHSRFCHIRAIGVSANMRRNVWYLHPVDVIVSANHMIESVLPVHCYKWHSIIIVK